MSGTEILTPFMAGLVALGGWGFVCIAMFFGWLVPKSRYDEMREDRNEQRKAAEEQRTANAVLAEAVKPLIEQVKTNNHLLESIKDRAPRSRS